MATIGTLQRISASSLSDLILAEQSSPSPKFAVIDVRDDDYIGGHIKGSLNFPSQGFDAMLPTLIRKLRDKETVVFHCALSQQRGPGAALRYLRARDRALGTKPETEAGKLSTADTPADTKENESLVTQNVYVLDRGFVGWQEVYGDDERLTEGYRKELWQDGYWD